MRAGIATGDVLQHCRNLTNQLAWRFVSYRHLSSANPDATRPLSTLGSLLGGGRYNVACSLARHHRPFGALYTSYTPDVAVKEMRFADREPTPHMCLPLRATLEHVIDLTNPDILASLGIDVDRLYGEWRTQSKILLQLAYPQQVASRLYDAGVEAILTHSVTNNREGTNLTVWPMNLRDPSHVSVVTDVDDPTVKDVLLPPNGDTPSDEDVCRAFKEKP